MINSWEISFERQSLSFEIVLNFGNTIRFPCFVISQDLFNHKTISDIYSCGVPDSFKLKSKCKNIGMK